MFNSPRWNKVIRDLWGNKVRTVLVVLAIAVGVFAFGMVATSRIVVGREIENDYRATNPATATMTVSAFDEDLVNFVEGLREVKDAEGRYEMSAKVEVAPDQWDTFYLTAVDNFDAKVGKMEAETGAWPPRRREVLLERSTVEIPGFPQTDILTIELPDGQEKELVMAGTLYDMAQFPATFYKEGYGYITFDTLEWLTGKRDYNRLLIVLEDTTNQRVTEQTITDIRERIEQEGYVVFSTTIPEDGKHWGSNMIAAISLIQGVIGSFSLVLSGFLVVNTISAILKQQLKQIGIMKTIGGRTSQVLFFYLATVLIFGSMAALVAVPAGVLGARGFIGYMAGFMNLNIPIVRPPLVVVILQLVIAITAPLIAATFPLMQGISIPAREAIYDQQTANNLMKQDFIDHIIEKIRGIPRPIMLSLRNTFRRKGRLALTSGTLTLAGAVFIAIFGLRASLEDQFHQIFGLFNYDVDVDFADDHRVEQLVREAERIDGVVNAEAWNSGLAQQVRPDDSEGATLPVFGVPPDTEYTAPTITEGRWLEADDTNAIVMMANLSLEDPDVYVGGPITLKVNGEEETLILVGTLSAIGDPTSDGFGYVPQDFYQQNWGDPGMANRVVIETVSHTIPYQVRVSRDEQDHFKDTLGFDVVGSVSSEEFQAGLTANISIIIRLYFVMAMLLAVVGGLGLAGTLSLNVLERTREIGVMRAVGASNFMVWRVVVLEGLVICGMSALLSVGLAVPVGFVLSQGVGRAFLGTPLAFHYSPQGAAAWIIFSFVLAVAASSLPARRAAMISVRESLAYE